MGRIFAARFFSPKGFFRLEKIKNKNKNLGVVQLTSGKTRTPNFFSFFFIFFFFIRATFDPPFTENIY